MQPRPIHILMNGVTGRMGRNQHLVRSILAIREQGGLRLATGEYLWPEPILAGRNEARVRALADEFGLNRWTTNLDAALADPDISIYFDAQVTSERAAAVKAAVAAGKHIYCEKPIAEDLPTALELARLAAKAGVKNGVEFSPCVVNLATGSLKEIGKPHSALLGTIDRKREVGSS